MDPRSRATDSAQFALQSLKRIPNVTAEIIPPEAAPERGTYPPADPIIIVGTPKNTINREFYDRSGRVQRPHKCRKLQPNNQRGLTLLNPADRTVVNFLLAHYEPALKAIDSYFDNPQVVKDFVQQQIRNEEPQILRAIQTNLAHTIRTVVYKGKEYHIPEDCYPRGRSVYNPFTGKVQSATWQDAEQLALSASETLQKVFDREQETSSQFEKIIKRLSEEHHWDYGIRVYKFRKRYV